jgi:hypothetical protein
MEKEWYKGLELLHNMSCQPEFHLSDVSDSELVGDFYNITTLTEIRQRLSRVLETV